MAIDPGKEIQHFGPYQLVIREKGGVVHAVLWKGGERLCTAEATDREQAVDEILMQMGIRTLKRARERGTLTPVPTDVGNVFGLLWDELNDGQRAMLSALYRARGRELGTLDLASAAGYHGHGGVNIWLGFAGLMFSEACPRGDLQLNKKGHPVPTSWFCTWDVDKRTWTMRSEVAQGMTESGCVA